MNGYLNMEKTMAKIILTKFFSLLLLAGISMALQAEPPAEGDKAPSFSLPDQTGTMHQLADYRGSWLLLYFYPKDDTPGCTTEACQFRDHITVLNALGVKIVGVSLDDQASHAAFADKHELPFALLADTDGSVTASYDALRDLLVAKFAKRYSFLIDPQGIIAKRYLDVDPEGHASEVAVDVKKLKKVAAAGEPALLN